VTTDTFKPRAKTTEQVVGLIKAVTHDTPQAAVVLGSGVSALNDLTHAHIFPFEELFGIAPTVSGHAGSLTIGRLPENQDVIVAVMRGRFHLYEGHDWNVVTLATRSFIEWGVKELFLTNAAGGVNSSFNVGDLMVITGFRDLLSEVWQKEGLQLLKKAPQDCQNDMSNRIISAGDELHRENKEFRALQKGVYAAFTGPSYETLAEIEMVRRLKCDAVGMSTVPELLTVANSGTAAAAISVITNVWSDDQPMGGHEEVLEASKAASRRLDQLFRHLLAKKHKI
jgi:purine-nucleoside phosphorylase